MRDLDWLTIGLSSLAAWLLAACVFLGLDVGRLWWRHRRRGHWGADATQRDEARRAALARLDAEQRQRLRVATRLGDRMDHPD